EPRIAPSTVSAIEWTHIRQRLPWPAIGSQVCARVGHHDAQNTSWLETAQAFAKKWACLAFQIEMLEKMLRVNRRDSAIRKRQAAPTAPKVHAGMRNDNEIEPFYHWIVATTAVYPDSIKRR